MNGERIKSQLTFLTEADKMKNVFRRTLITDGSRRENDAEHSWHLALMAMVLKEYALSDDVDIDRVIRMCLVHDLVEIYAGDTFCYDKQGARDKEQREREAADKLFAILPDGQGAEYRTLWEEFDAMETPDAKYAAAADRLQPLLNNYINKGNTWKEGNATSADVYARMAMVKEGMPLLWPVVEYIVEDAIGQGFLQR
jgi:putative hydrolase of HD superfamily